MKRFPYRSRAPRHNVWQSPARSPALMLAEVRDHADRGDVVTVIRHDGGAFQVVKNDTLWLIRTTAGDALATMDTVGEAVMAGNRYLDGPAADADSDGNPRGAA